MSARANLSMCSVLLTFGPKEKISNKTCCDSADVVRSYAYSCSVLTSVLLLRAHKHISLYFYPGLTFDHSFASIRIRTISRSRVFVHRIASLNFCLVNVCFYIRQRVRFLLASLFLHQCSFVLLNFKCVLTATDHVSKSDDVTFY